jgi:hypothetical protein
MDCYMTRESRNTAFLTLTEYKIILLHIPCTPLLSRKLLSWKVLLLEAKYCVNRCNEKKKKNLQTLSFIYNHPVTQVQGWQSDYILHEAPSSHEINRTEITVMRRIQTLEKKKEFTTASSWSWTEQTLNTLVWILPAELKYVNIFLCHSVQAQSLQKWRNK